MTLDTKIEQKRPLTEAIGMIDQSRVISFLFFAWRRTIKS